jgi:hypothetical protein
VRGSPAASWKYSSPCALSFMGRQAPPSRMRWPDLSPFTCIPQAASADSATQRCHILERYADSAAVLTHLGTSGVRALLSPPKTREALPNEALQRPAQRSASGRETMTRITLEWEHSVDAEVSPAFAWRFRTDVANWNDPPAIFALDGAFAAGSRGTTLLPGQDPLHWRIAEARPCESFVLELELDRAALTFEWRFDALSEYSTRLTQLIVLAGENAAAYAKQIEAAFGSNLAEGMRRVAAEMEAAENALKGRHNKTPQPTSGA